MFIAQQIEIFHDLTPGAICTAHVPRYGNVAPQTEWGKLATIVYAIAGMPLFLLYLSNIGDILAKSFKWTYAQCCLCRWCSSSSSSKKERSHGHRRRHRRRYSRRSSLRRRGSMWEGDPGPWPGDEGWPPDTEDEDSDDSDVSDDSDEESEEHLEDEARGSETVPPRAPRTTESVTVPVSLCLAIMVGYVCGGAVLFAMWEDWDFLDGSYFCFISLSTIGFGDIVPGDRITSGNGVELSFIFCSAYLMLGMALIAMCFSLMQEEVVHKMRGVVRAAKATAMCVCGACRRRTPQSEGDIAMEPVNLR
ncbi:hypothetical protein J437_LFUL015243 [Ladona fulva]|uniref:Potassium channel domain-containing protein n=1 Tax=Ladona fulva TaxID=123851 RepID=A0A8K0P6J2_LADFU|nr:hypothetical protein J437_LFUL015243 [Ladona fulva]